MWIDYFKGAVTRQTEALDQLLAQESLAIGDLILAEVLQGFPDERSANEALELLTSLVLVDLCGHDVAIQAARNFRALRASWSYGSQDN